MVPQLEEMGPDVGQRARVLLYNVQVLLSQLPHGRAPALKEGRVVQVALWEVGREEGLVRSQASYRGAGKTVNTVH